MNIGSVIKKYRKVSGFTQEEMANRLGVTTPAVNKWENGVSQTKGYSGTTCVYLLAKRRILLLSQSTT